MSNPSTSNRTLMALRDECERLCRFARRHDEQLRTMLQTLEAAKHQAGSSAEAFKLAERALKSGTELQEMAQSLLTRLEAEAAERIEAGSHSSTAVLVVDDLEDARVLIAETLAQAGFLVRTAENGLDALISTYEWQPAVIVMDITMPVLDGIEATRLIKAGHATRDARVIAHTAKPSSAEMHLQRLFDAVVPKPCMPDILLDAVREVAARPAGGLLDADDGAAE